MDKAIPEPQSHEPDADRLPNFSGKSVLVVDDNEINQLIAAGLLAESGACVCVVASGSEAIAELQARPFDLVLMDVQMPGMDGLEATREIRRIPPLAALPIVAMTATRSQDAERGRCLEAGMNDLVAKPLEVNELFDAIGRWTVRGG